eukprot:7304827-Alexandrium_andersonii.AAC.1
MTVMDCTRAFLDMVSPAEGPGLQSVQEALTGAAWLGPDPRVAFAPRQPWPRPLQGARGVARARGD